jgi:two-component system, NarL family, response regulator DevR
MHVLHVEDDRLVANAVARSLRRGGIEVEVAYTWGAAYQKITRVELRLDAAVIDLRLPDGNGATLLPMLRERGVPVVVTSNFIDDESPALRGVTCLQKPYDAAALVRVLVAAAGAGAAQPRAFALEHGLSARELQMVALSAAGMRGRELAAHMNCSLHTVREYWQRVIRKTGLAGRSAVVAKYQARR